MASNSNRKTRLAFDSLERRDTPSAAAFHHASEPLRGSGAGKAVLLDAGPNGGSDTVVAYTGQAAPLGTFSGTLSASLATNNRTLSATGNLSGVGGALMISVTGKFRGSSAVRIVNTGNFHFNVVNGTGDYAGDTGGGRLMVTINQATGGASFTINGRVRS